MIFYHGTSEENWQKIQDEGVLWSRRYIINGKTGAIIKEVDRCTCLALHQGDAKCFGNVILEVEYNPYDKNGKIKRDKNGCGINNYNPESWQLRVYEPIPIENVKRIL